ncbi:MAG: esterase-like activity of phytase family protein, partial [Verrucomicrobiales bacterium]|nr:esterase-like activity of phytase family protein [Verrucomicrobiales bacterium]
MHRAPRPFPISSIAAFAGLALAIPAPVEGASREYTVHLQPSKFTLYTDPYTSEEILLGGFSGLYPAPGGHDRYYVVTDRGPAPDFVDQNGIGYKTWAVPEFGPHIVTVDLQPNGKAMVRDVRPLTRPDGTAITGLPTSLPFTDAPYDFDLNPLPLDEDSLDAEGITLDGRGYFWICEEYKPSVAKVAPDGRVLLRLVPAGTRTGIETVPTLDVLPAVLAKRRNNRGFEGIAASTDGMLYAILQRPLNNPNRAAADANGNGRIVAIDLNALETGQTVIRQYLYPMPPANG